MFEPEVFRKQMYCIDVLVTLLGLFGALPQSFGAPIAIRRPGHCAPLAPHRYAPAQICFLDDLGAWVQLCKIALNLLFEVLNSSATSMCSIIIER